MKYETCRVKFSFLSLTCSHSTAWLHLLCSPSTLGFPSPSAVPTLSHPSKKTKILPPILGDPIQVSLSLQNFPHLVTNLAPTHFPLLQALRQSCLFCSCEYSILLNCFVCVLYLPNYIICSRGQGGVKSMDYVTAFCILLFHATALLCLQLTRIHSY